MGPWLNLEKYPLAHLVPFLAGCSFWVIVYGIYIHDIVRHRRAEMPIVAGLSNLAWEFLWSWVFKPDMGLLVWWGYRAWFFLDLFIIYGLLRYGEWQVLSAEHRRYFRWSCAFGLVFWLGFYYFFTAEGHDTSIGANSAYIAQMLISVFYLWLMVRQGNWRRFSYPVVWLRTAGSGLTTVFMFLHYRDGEHRLLLTMAGTALVLDVVCIWVFSRHRRAAPSTLTAPAS